MKKSTMVVLIMALSITACISGCGKQEEIVNAATVEEVTTVTESEDTEESVIATEEETESIQESETNETESSDGEYNELDEKETDKTVDETANTNETDNDVTAAVAEATGAKTVIIDGEVYIDLGGDDNDVYVPPTGDTTPSGSVTIVNPDGTTQTSKTGSGNDEEFVYDSSDPNIPTGHHIQ